MYIPRHFRKEEIDELHAFMQQHSFAALVSQHESVPFATHIPFLLRPEQGEYGSLVGHMARANPQWRDFDTAQEVLVIFQGPHAYISPSWYEVELSVPTWNYAVVHAYGTPRIIENHDELYAILKASVNTYEAGFEHPWPMDLPTDYTDKMMKAIVGFEIQLTRLEGKYKLSQNRSSTDQKQVTAALQAMTDPVSRATGELMEALVPSPKS